LRSIVLASCVLLYSGYAGGQSGMENKRQDNDKTEIQMERPSLPQKGSVEGIVSPLGGGASVDQSSNGLSYDVFYRLDQMEVELRALRGQIDRILHTESMRKGDLNDRVQRVEGVVSGWTPIIAGMETATKNLRSELTRLQLQVIGINNKIPLADSEKSNSSNSNSSEASGKTMYDLSDLGVSNDEDVADKNDKISSGNKASDSVLGKFQALPSQESGIIMVKALNFMREDNLIAAEQKLRRVIEAAVDDQHVGSAKYWLGEIYVVHGNLSQAGQHFLSSFSEYPSNPQAPLALLKFGTLMVDTDKRLACKAFSQLVEQYPAMPEFIKKRRELEWRRAGCGR
jgi:TolA-binding protein